jgi:hypothetical protein
MKRILLLDLEETLIETFTGVESVEDVVFLDDNIDAIRKFIEAATPDAVGIMSWAIYDKADALRFNSHLKKELEKRLDLEFDSRLPLTMDEYASQIFQHAGVRLSKADLFDILRKEQMLFFLALRCPIFDECEVTLIDDAVQDRVSLKTNSPQCFIDLRNVHVLVGEMDEYEDVWDETWEDE